MSKDNEVVIVAAARTAIGTFGGTLKNVRAHILAAHVMCEVLKRANNLDPNVVSDVIVGDCLQNVDEANTARVAALAAGIPHQVTAFTVQRNCASSMQALISGTQQILCQDSEVVLVAGVESMSSGPYYLDKARWGMRLRNHEVIDSVWEALYSGSRLLGESMIMGITAENLAEKDDISREDQDQVALECNNKAEAAIKAGLFAEEIVPMEVSGDKGESVVFLQDEHPRFGLSIEDLAKLKPVFKKDGIVTAGNASQISDGASAVVVMSEEKAKELGLKPLAKIIDYTTSGVEPELVMEAPIPCVRKLLTKTKKTINDVDLFEHNEAFATASCAVKKELKVPEDIFNVHGGAVALGHPIGCSGARVLVTLMYAMKDKNAHRGVATLCLGGGNAVGMMIER